MYHPSSIQRVRPIVQTSYEASCRGRATKCWRKGTELLERQLKQSLLYLEARRRTSKKSKLKEGCLREALVLLWGLPEFVLQGILISRSLYVKRKHLLATVDAPELNVVIKKTCTTWKAKYQPCVLSSICDRVIEPAFLAATVVASVCLLTI